MNTIHTIDIKLAAILDTFGIAYRKSDPVTCIVETINDRRHEQFTFWFEAKDDFEYERAKGYVEAFYQYRKGQLSLGEEHPIYYMLAAMENREVRLNWIRQKVEPLKRTQIGDKTILLAERARPELREKFKAMASSMG